MDSDFMNSCGGFVSQHEAEVFRGLLADRFGFSQRLLRKAAFDSMGIFPDPTWADHWMILHRPCNDCMIHSFRANAGSFVAGFQAAEKIALRSLGG